MAKIHFSSLKLRQDISAKPVKINDDITISVKNYLPISEKAALINEALKLAEGQLAYDEVLLDAYFHLLIVFHYTNITFNETQKQYMLKLYDLLESNGVILKVVEALGTEEYTDLLNYLDETKKNNMSILGAIKSILKSDVEQLEQVTQQLQQFDINNYENVVEFVKAANGGRFPAPATE